MQLASTEKWQSIFANCSPIQPVTSVLSPLTGRSSSSKCFPVLAMNKRTYWVKGWGNGASTYTDQVVGLIGMLMKAPVGEVVLIEVSPKLAESRRLATFYVNDVLCTLAHGSLHIQRAHESTFIKSTANTPENQRLRSRYAKLAILYGWAKANDRQFMYDDDDKGVVYSIDHGKFFPGGANWTDRSLVRELQRAPCLPDQTIAEAAMLSPIELARATRELKEVSDMSIAQAVWGPPAQWGPDVEQRYQLAHFLAERRDQLISYFARVHTMGSPR